ncbi:NAD-dependent epimerase/dehydratase family protein [Neobacillus sp. 179-J 1A1 HS]|uniref:NAD-dependent epimerase/dehydratase family protein n=1 Tax=Neobacillus driksii TaxID=3035913 RepID=UPI0035BC906A
MKSALILGGTQFVGKRLVRLLIDEGVEVTVATRGLTADAFGNQVSRLIIKMVIHLPIICLGHGR